MVRPKGKVMLMLSITGLSLLIIGVLMATVVVANAAEKPAALDHWAGQKDRRIGDTFRVGGVIESKRLVNDSNIIVFDESEMVGMAMSGNYSDLFYTGSVYEYILEDSETPLISMDDIGSEGDTLVITVEKKSDNVFYISNQANHYFWTVSGVLFAVLGAIMLLFSMEILQPISGYFRK